MQLLIFRQDAPLISPHTAHSPPERFSPLTLSGHRPGLQSVSHVCSDHYAAGTKSNYFASVLVLGLRTAPFYGITHIVEYQDRDGRHALPLFGTKRLVEWLPRLGEFIQIG